jgi:hypothetical protein
VEDPQTKQPRQAKRLTGLKFRWSTRPGSQAGFAREALAERSSAANRRPPRWQGDAGLDFIEVFRPERSYRCVSVNSGGRIRGLSRSPAFHSGPGLDGELAALWLHPHSRWGRTPSPKRQTSVRYAAGTVNDNAPTETGACRPPQHHPAAQRVGLSAACT